MKLYTKIWNILSVLFYLKSSKWSKVYISIRNIVKNNNSNCKTNSKSQSKRELRSELFLDQRVGRLARSTQPDGRT